MRKFIIPILLFIAFRSEAQEYGINGNISSSPVSLFNNAFCDSIKSLNVTYWRFPGGNYADNYHWTKTDIQALAYMIHRNGMTVIWVLNVINETKENERAMLQYAHDSCGLDISKAEFGNELSNGGNVGRVKFHSSGIEYGDTCKHWAAYIKLKFPLAAFACWTENKQDLPQWRAQLLSVYTPDAEVNHDYAKGFARKGITDTALLRSFITTSFKRSGVDLKNNLWITEFNVDPDYIDSLLPGEHETAILYMAKVFSEYGIKIGIVHNIVGSYLGAFYVTKDQIVLLSTGRAVKLLTKPSLCLTDSIGTVTKDTTVYFTSEKCSYKYSFNFLFFHSGKYLSCVPYSLPVIQQISIDTIYKVPCSSVNNISSTYYSLRHDRP